MAPAAGSGPGCATDRHPSRTQTTLNLHVWAPAFTGFGGGIGSFSRSIATAMRDLGHEVALSGKADKSGSWNGMRLSGSGASPLFRTSRFAALCLRESARQRPDEIISTHLNFGPVARVARRAWGIPYTLVAHGIDVHGGLPAMTLSALAAAGRVIAVSAWTRGRLIELDRVRPERIHVLPNTFDETRFFVGPRSPALVERYQIQPDEKVVLTVARLDARERYKGYDRIVEALPAIHSACGRVRALLVGEGDDVERVRAVARRLGVESSVTFTGFVADDELADHYRIADVFAMPSVGEGFGIVYVEAMACGTPVLAGDRDGSVDALAGGSLGRMVDPEDPGAVAAGVISLLREEGPPHWFDRASLSHEVIRRFGNASFRRNVDLILASPAA